MFNYIRAILKKGDKSGVVEFAVEEESVVENVVDKETFFKGVGVEDVELKTVEFNFFVVEVETVVGRIAIIGTAKSLSHWTGIATASVVVVVVVDLVLLLRHLPFLPVGHLPLL